MQHSRYSVTSLVWVSVACIGVGYALALGLSSTPPTLVTYGQFLAVLASLGIIAVLLSIVIYARGVSRRRDYIGTILNAQLEALYSEHQSQRAAARDIIRGLMESGALSTEQLVAASTALKHWHAINWEPYDEADANGPSGAVAWSRSNHEPGQDAG